MSDPMETKTGSSSSAQPQTGYATQPNAFRPGASVSAPVTPYGATGQSVGGWAMKPYLLGAVIAALVLFLVYQQTQITHLSNELSLVSDNIKSSDVRDRLEAQATNLQELNKRLTYLDSKINATDQKAQLALNKLKENEENDIFGNAIKNLKHAFGLQ